MLRFQEARGVHYDHPASDSSWSPLEVKDLDANQGSHIRPGKLRDAVDAGFIKDLDNYFQVKEVSNEAKKLAKDVEAGKAKLAELAVELENAKAVAEAAKKAVDEETDDKKKKELKKSLKEHDKAVAELQKQVADLTVVVSEKEAKVAELSK